MTRRSFLALAATPLLAACPQLAPRLPGWLTLHEGEPGYDVLRDAYGDGDGPQALRCVESEQGVVAWTVPVNARTIAVRFEWG